MIHPEKTDVAYSGMAPEALTKILENMQRVFGFGGVEVLTTEMVMKDRLLLHSAINQACLHLGFDGIGEVERGENILQAVRKIFDGSKRSYDAGYDAALQTISRQKKSLKAFVDALVGGNATEPKTVAEREAQRVFALAQTRRQHRDPDELKTLVTQWAEIRLEHSELQRFADGITAQNIHKLFSEQERLPIHSHRNHPVMFFAGGMGAGKTILTQTMLDRMQIPARSILLSDPDALKKTLAHYAHADGVISKTLDDSTNNWGVLVHGESSNVRFEETRTLLDDAKHQNPLPMMVVNSLVPGAFEMEMAITSGAKIHVELITVDLERAWQDVLQRSRGGGDLEKVNNRTPSEESFQFSHKKANHSLVQMADYAGRDVDMYVRERKGHDLSKTLAYYNIKANMLFITDAAAFVQMSARAYQSGDSARDVELHLRALQEKQCSIVMMEKGVVSCVLGSDKTLRILDAAAFMDIENVTAIKQALENLSEKKLMGDVGVSRHYGNLGRS